MSSETIQTMSFSAKYTSPTNAPFTVTHELQTPPSGTTDPNVSDKVKYLSDLRKATATIQEQVNKELTQRMDEDKAREATKNGHISNVDEAKEEENYGEEVQEED